MKGRGLVIMIILAIAAPASAITHATSLKFPIVPRFEPCGADTDTAVCSYGDTGTASDHLDPQPTWTYSEATVEISDDGKVSLRIDDFAPVGEVCPVNNACDCSASPYGNCGVAGDCSGTPFCGAPNGMQIEVEIFAQNFTKNFGSLAFPCSVDSCIRRSYASTLDCNETFTFTFGVGADINVSTAADAWHCDGYLSGYPGEIRDVQVRIVDPDLTNPTTDREILGVMGYKQP